MAMFMAADSLFVVALAG